MALLIYYTMQSYPMKPNNVEYTVFVTTEPKKSDFDHGLINIAKLSVSSHINQSPFHEYSWKLCRSGLHQTTERRSVIFIAHTSPIAADITITYNTVMPTPLTPL